MLLSRTMLIAVAASLFVVGGCTTRQDSVLISELRSENARLTQELNALQETARNLEIERNFVQEENVRLRAQAVGLSRQLENIDTDRLGREFRANEITGGVTVDQDMLFRLGSAEVTDEGKAALGRLVQELNRPNYRNTVVVVEGHTDDTPVTRPQTIERFGDNWGLSAMRAASVIRVLQEQGLDSQRLRGAFSGEYRPAVRNTTRENKARNRRVEIFLNLAE